MQTNIFLAHHHQMVGYSNHLSSMVSPSFNNSCYCYFSESTEGIFLKFHMWVPLGTLLCILHFGTDWKTRWLTGGHLWFWELKFVIAISQKVLKGSFWHVVVHIAFGTVRKTRWPTFWAQELKFVIAISQKFLLRSFSDFIWRFSLFVIILLRIKEKRREK